jgi:hypothetical protein
LILTGRLVGICAPPQALSTRRRGTINVVVAAVRRPSHEVTLAHPVNQER